MDVDIGENDGQGFDGIMSLRPGPLAPPKKKTAEPVKPEPVIPVTAGPYTLREVLQKADVLLHVVDARDPAAGISEVLFKEATGKDILLLVNKIGRLFVLSMLGIDRFYLINRYHTTRVSGTMALSLAINVQHPPFSRSGGFLAFQTQSTSGIEEGGCQIGRCAWLRRRLAAAQQAQNQKIW